MAQLVQSGLPKPVAEFFSQFMEAYQLGVFEDVNPGLENLLGRKPTSIRKFLKETYLDM